MLLYQFIVNHEPGFHTYGAIQPYERGIYFGRQSWHGYSDPWPGMRNFGERVHGFSTDIVTDKAIEWMKAQDKDTPFLMCCHFKATHEPYDFPERMRHLYDGVVFEEPESLMDFGPETNGRTFPGQPLEEMVRRWTVASAGPHWCEDGPVQAYFPLWRASRDDRFF